MTRLFLAVCCASALALFAGEAKDDPFEAFRNKPDPKPATPAPEPKKEGDAVEKPAKEDAGKDPKKSGGEDDEDAIERERLKKQKVIDDEKAQKEAVKAAKKKEEDEIAAKKAEAAKPKVDDAFDKFAKTEGLKPKKEDPKPATKSIIPVTPGKPAEVCAVCRGVGILPAIPFKSFSRFSDQPAAAGPDMPPFRLCERCQRGVSPSTVYDSFKITQEVALEKHKKYEETLGQKLLFCSTPFFALHTNLNQKESRVAAAALDELVTKLVRQSNSLALLTSRADENQLLAMANTKSYVEVIDKVFAAQPQQTRDQAKGNPGFGGPHEQAWNFDTSDPSKGNSLKPRIINAAGAMLIKSATLDLAPHWLVEGFTSFCEYETTGANLMAPGNANDFKPTKYFNDDMKKIVKEGKIRPWKDVFASSPGKTKMVEFIEAFSIVTFLIRSDPVRFDKFVVAVRDGEECIAALEKTYGRKVGDLEGIWRNGIQTQK